MDLLMQYLIICPLVMLAGFIDAIAGGGGLISLPAYMIAGIPVHHAIATNKMSSTMGTALATFKFARKGFIPWKLRFPASSALLPARPLAQTWPFLSMPISSCSS